MEDDMLVTWRKTGRRHAGRHGGDMEETWFTVRALRCDHSVSH